MNSATNSENDVSQTRESVAKTLWPRPLVVAIVAGFALRLAVYHWSDLMTGLPRTPNAPYAWELGNIARAIVMGKGYSSPLPVETGPTAFLTPIFPYFVALLFKIFGIYSRAAELGIIYFNSAASAMTCWPLYHIGRRIHGASFGLLAARIWTFLPTAVFCPITWLWDTSLLTFLTAVLLWATLVLAESTRLRDWLGYGALWAFTAMTNPAPLVLLPFYLGWSVLRAQKPPAVKLIWATLSLAVFATGVSPWMIRNYLVFDKVVPFRSIGGVSLSAANNPTSGGDWLNPNNPYDNPVERRKYQTMGEIAYSAQAQRRGIEFIRSHPGQYATYVLRRIRETWTGPWIPLPDLLPYVSWQKQAEASLYICRLFSLLTFVGLWLAYRSRLPGTWLLGVSLLVFPVVYYLIQTMLRYRHPIDPMMTLLTAYAAYYPAHAWSARRKRAHGSTAPMFEAKLD